MTTDAQAIYDEARASLEVLNDLIEQGVLPDVEADDFRASLARIADLAVRAGAVHG